MKTNPPPFCQRFSDKKSVSMWQRLCLCYAMFAPATMLTVGTTLLPP